MSGLSPAPAYLGLDVGGTNVRLAVWNEGLPRTVATRPLPADRRSFLTLVAELVAPYRAAGLGIGLPGVAFDQHVTWVPNAPFLAGTDLIPDLAAMCRAPAFSANDAHTALLAEARFGAARDARVALLVSVGTGVGGGVLIDGRVFRGASGSAGSFGWMNLGLPDLEHPEHGQLELVGSGTALAAAARGLGLTPQGLIAAARAGQASAVAIVDELAHHLGVALGTLASVFDPEIMLVAGGLSAEFDLLAPGISAAVRRWASPSGRTVPVAQAALGPDAGAIGAAVLAKEGRTAFI